ncbi:hypothetical protein LEP1GSC037_2043 [Leptospira interrogans str. 2006001854]|uniref:Uncharacterized protein n=1 Tax=Leptospira interrogans str. 2006001854 TaxID=1001590 RepID=M6GD41_LEPIR|nr:hypothetical protein LEP1GSC037_2043 [Leptospira interrogans str. 2006001854]
MFLNRFTGMSLDKIDLFRARAGTGSLFPFLAALLMPFFNSDFISYKKTSKSTCIVCLADVI